MRKKVSKNHRLKAYRQGKKQIINIWPILIPLLIIGAILLYVFCSASFFAGKNKLSVAIQGKNGEIIVSTFDPVTEEITNLTIPGTTQLTVSRQLGSWKVKSLWKLGENEKLGGALLSESIVRNFHLPISAWASESHIGLARGNVGQIIKSLFSFKGSNLGFGDKIKLAIFSLGLGDGKRFELNMDETNYLRKEKLVDGELGYMPASKIPNSLLVVFGNQGYGQKGYKAGIKDFTGKALIGQEVGSTLEVLGIKVASVEKLDNADFDCRVSGMDKAMVGEISKIFECGSEIKNLEGNFDLVVELGEKFGKRY
jgi:hypothetical protein